METYLFTPKNEDTLDTWSQNIYDMYAPRKPVRMIVDLSNYSKFDINMILGLKCILDHYRPVTKIYLHDTHIKINDPLLKTFVKSCLVLFKPEKPVKFI